MSAPAIGRHPATAGTARRSGVSARGHGLGAAIVMAALALLCGLQCFALIRAPAAWMPADVRVTLAAGESLVLDGGALGVPRGSDARLRLRRDAQGRWWVAGAGASAPLALVRDGHARRTASAVPAAGQRFQIGSAHFTVDEAGARSVAFSGRGARWQYDGAVLRRDGTPQPACPDSRPAARVAAFWNGVAPSALTLARPLVFGGNLDCGNRIAVAGLPEPGLPTAMLSRTADGLLLTGGAAPLPLQDPGGAVTLLAEREAAVDGAGALVLGRSRLAIDAGGAALHLKPLTHVALYAEAQQSLPPAVAWTWTRRAAWAWPAVFTLPAAAIVLCAALAGASASRAAPGLRLACASRAAGAVLLCGAGVASLALQRGAGFPSPGASLLVAWAALWYTLLSGRRGTLATGAGMLLLAVGLLAQLDLGLGAPASSWLRHFHKSAAVLALGAGTVGLVRACAPAVRPSQARVEVLLLALTGTALLALLLQVVFGDETGVFDLQPVEFAKLALTALTAHCLALGTAGNRRGAGPAWRRWLRLLSPMLLFLALLAVALVQVDDYSPLVLLLVWGAALALAGTLGAGRHRAALLLAALVCGLVLGVAALRGAGADRIGEWSARWNFYPDRFMVWLAPNDHPHTGQQVLLGARAVLDGGWWGADSALGLRALGRDTGSALRIPAVQDDFAPAFFLGRHGLAVGLALWLLQALFLAGLLWLALRWWQAGTHARDYRAAWQARLRCFCLVGGAAFAFGHFLLSWGTNLAILPVMGQPMSFLSAGGSHLLFFLCPLLGLAAAGAPAPQPHD